MSKFIDQIQWIGLSSAFGILAVIAAALLAVVVVLRVRSRRKDGRFIIVDGSNVMYWRNDQPDLTPVRAVIRSIEASGARPVVWFDANAGYLLVGKYQSDQAMARSLHLPPHQVKVAPKGTPADPLILHAAGLLDARIVTNDRYRDWVDEYPLLRERYRLIRGKFQNGTVYLPELDRDETLSPKAA